jgi:hypothetical protein
MGRDAVNPIGGKIFLWLLLLIGIWMIWSGRGGETVNPRKDWKTTTGRVLAVQKVEPMTDITGKRFTGPKGWDFRVSYSFQVDGKHFRGSYSYHDPVELPEPRYEENDRTTVYYDPKSPVHSSLDSGYGLTVTKEMKRARVFSGAVMVVAALFFLVLLKRKERQSREAA